MQEKKSNIVRIEYEPASPPSYTKEQEEELRRLSLKPDSEIDYSDIPPVKDFTGWQRSSKRRHIWLDEDIGQWLYSQGEDCQAAANAILRKEMLAAVKDKV